MVPVLVEVTGTVARNGKPVSGGHVKLQSTVTYLSLAVLPDASFTGVAPAGTSYEVRHRAEDAGVVQVLLLEGSSGERPVTIESGETTTLNL